MQNLLIEVAGEPIAQPRHQIANGHAYIDKKHPVHAWKVQIRSKASQMLPREWGVLTGPLRVTLDFLMPRTKGMFWKKKPMLRCYHKSKPDIDNLAKACLDALLDLVFVDDSQVCVLRCQKFYCAGDENPGVIIQVTELPSESDAV